MPVRFGEFLGGCGGGYEGGVKVEFIFLKYYEDGVYLLGTRAAARCQSISGQLKLEILEENI